MTSFLEARDSLILSQLFTSDVGRGPEKLKTDVRVTHENPTHGVPAFQIEMANMASAAGRSPVSSWRTMRRCRNFRVWRLASTEIVTSSYEHPE